MHHSLNVLKEYRDFMILKNFSPRTIKTYLQIVDYFLKFSDIHFPTDTMSDDMVRKYLVHRFEKGLAWQSVNSDYSSIQKFFKNVLFLPWSLTKLPRPKKEKKLPSIFSKEDVCHIINAAPTFKHQVILSTFYATGCRLSELNNICLTDIDGHRNQIRINRGKGHKDRFIQVPVELILLLRRYFLAYKPVKYLFNGSERGKPYSVRTLQYILKQAKSRAGISKKGGIHTLRNCFATHHLETGTDLVFLQEQLGHKNLRTTIGYIHLCVQRHRYIHHPILDLQIRYKDQAFALSSGIMDSSISIP